MHFEKRFTSANCQGLTSWLSTCKEQGTDTHLFIYDRQCMLLSTNACTSFVHGKSETTLARLCFKLQRRRVACSNQRNRIRMFISGCSCYCYLHHYGHQSLSQICSGAVIHFLTIYIKFCILHSINTWTRLSRRWGASSLYPTAPSVCW